MANVRVRWVLPTERESGRPLAVTDIDHVRIEISADGGANYALVGDFPPNVLETVVADVDFGEWTFRGIVEDTKGRLSQPSVDTIVVEDTTPPGTLTLDLSFA